MHLIHERIVVTAVEWDKVRIPEPSFNNDGYREDIPYDVNITKSVRESMTDAEIIEEYYVPLCSLVPQNYPYVGQVDPNFQIFLSNNCEQCGHSQEEDCAQGWWCKYLTVGHEATDPDPWRWDWPQTDQEKWDFIITEEERQKRHPTREFRFRSKTARDEAIRVRLDYPMQWVIRNGIAICLCKIPVEIEKGLAIAFLEGERDESHSIDLRRAR